MLLKTTKTAIHRMPPGINDFSVGENSLDKADIDEIIGHLVSKKGRGAAVTASLFQIGFPQLPHSLGRQIRHALRKSLADLRLGEGLCNHRYVGQFTGTVNERMTGKNLLQ